MTFNVPELEEGKHATSSVSNHLNFYEQLMLGLNRVKLILFILGFFVEINLIFEILIGIHV